ncbi:hypothetical protein [Enterobacter sp. 9-2]|uniref:hypothetical protein n=1 Tax=Enterobacter sp. 9-2 TaxID=559106 RepID=UPI001CB92C81|nr:hypothetical protein [Enterobacter sp. 9-2]
MRSISEYSAIIRSNNTGSMTSMHIDDQELKKLINKKIAQKRERISLIQALMGYPRR